MQQDRPAGFLDHLVDRPEMLLVDRRAVGIGGKLNRIGAPNLLLYKHCIKYIYKNEAE